jgi:signal transduction histidine kinase
MRLTLVQEAQAASVVMICDGRGQIRRVIRDTIGLDEIFAERKTLQELTEPGGAARARAFVEATRLGEPIEEWPLEVTIFARRVTLCFVGCAVRFNHLLVIAADSRSALIRTCEESLECDPSPELPESAINQFLAALRSEPRPARDSFEHNARLYGELDTMQRELNLRSSELSRAAEERNRLYAAVAHDLRSPLAAVNGYAGLMLDDDADAMQPEARESLLRIKASSESAIDLIDSLLDPSTIDGGRLELKKRMVKLSEVISGVIAVNQFFAQRRNVRLDTSFNEGLLPIAVDSGRIAQVLNHLVANAIKFSPTGGIVNVGLEQSPLQATIRVADHGPGFSRARLTRIFSIPHVHNVLASRAKPIGVGLAICRKVISAHGGRLEVASDQNRGTTFTVVIPVRQTAQSRGVAPSHHAPVSG